MEDKDTLVEEAVELAESSATIINELQDKNAALETELQTTKTALEVAQQNVKKQAEDAAGTPVFAEGRVLQSVEGMVQAGFIKQAQQAEVVQTIETNPEMCLIILDKLAERKVRSVTPMGKVAGEDVGAVDLNSDELHRDSDALWEDSTNRLRARLGT